MKRIFFLFFFVLFVEFLIFSQKRFPGSNGDFRSLFDSIMDDYRFDQVFVNGISYEKKYRTINSHPFFLDDKIYKGQLLYKGKEYKDTEMKYDIYAQQLVVYVKNNSSMISFVPSIEYISAFKLGDTSFIKCDLQGEIKFYQIVFKTEKIECYYHWYKEIRDIENIGNSVSYEFTESTKDNYLKINDLVEKYHNNKSFIKLFPKEIKTKVQHYLKTNHIKVTKCNVKLMKELLTYCDSLL